MRRLPRAERALTMFTGIIEAVGKIADVTARGGDTRLVVDVGSLPFSDVVLGESIAVSGVCLTVVEFDGARFAADVSNETLSRTTLSSFVAGTPVNLERAMLPTTRFGGHVVAGHVDGVGAVADIQADGRSQRWHFDAPGSLLRYVAEKGSICVDGVALTVNAVHAAGFEVNLVPHTIEHTAFAACAVGTSVNLEVDLIARYVERLLSTRDSGLGIGDS